MLTEAPRNPKHNRWVGRHQLKMFDHPVPGVYHAGGACKHRVLNGTSRTAPRSAQPPLLTLPVAPAAPTLLPLPGALACYPTHVSPCAPLRAGRRRRKSCLSPFKSPHCTSPSRLCCRCTPAAVRQASCSTLETASRTPCPCTRVSGRPRHEHHRTSARSTCCTSSQARAARLGLHARYIAACGLLCRDAMYARYGALTRVPGPCPQASPCRTPSSGWTLRGAT